MGKSQNGCFKKTKLCMGENFGMGVLVCVSGDKKILKKKMKKSTGRAAIVFIQDIARFIDCMYFFIFQLVRKYAITE